MRNRWNFRESGEQVREAANPLSKSYACQCCFFGSLCSRSAIPCSHWMFLMSIARPNRIALIWNALWNSIRPNGISPEHWSVIDVHVGSSQPRVVLPYRLLQSNSGIKRIGKRTEMLSVWQPCVAGSLQKRHQKSCQSGRAQEEYKHYLFILFICLLIPTEHG